MEIDSAVEETVAPRRRPTSRAVAGGPSHSAPNEDGGSSTAVAEAPPVNERPTRETRSVSSPPVKAASQDSAPQSVAPEPESEPIVTETILKPKAEATKVSEPSLPTPVLPEAADEVEEAPPAFSETFAPPPSVVPPSETPSALETPPELEETPGSAVPQDGHDLSDFDLPVEDDSDAPAVEKTQPIRTIERPSNLPPMHSVSQTDAGDLPRLDVSLAGEAGTISRQGKTSEKADGQEKTKLRLPEPGEDSKRFTPADFIAPESNYDSEVLENPVEEAGADPYPGINPADSDESYRIVDSEESYPAADFDPIPLDSLEEPNDEPEVPPFVVSTEVAPTTEQSLDDLEVDDDEASEFSKWDPLATPDPENAPEMLPDEDPGEGHLDEGSFEKLFAQQSSEPSASEPNDQGFSLPRDPVAAQSSADSAAVPPAFDPAVPSHGPASEVRPVVRSESRPDNDVLEEMFGSSKSSSYRPKKSTLIMLGVVALLMTVAVVIVVVAGSALGFWGDSPTTMDPVTEAPESMKPREEGPELAEEPSSSKSTPADSGAETGNVPEAIDTSEAENPGNGNTGEEAISSTLSLPGDTENPVRIVDSSAPANSSVAPSSLQESSESVIGNPAPAEEPEALSFDERVQNIVNGNGLNADAPESIPETMNAPSSSGEQGSFAAANDTPAGAPAQIENYNPPESFAAPGPDDGPLGKTHDLIDAFLRAPDWETRSKYVYHAESLMPTMEEYYKKWPDRRLDRYSHQLYAMESDVEFGGPYWVYLISQSDDDQGYPFIIRVEDGKLKVDWESHSEFFDRHWVKFQQGGIAVPHTFRVAIERVSDYYGPDRDQFENLGDYLVYKINPPYGGDDEFMEYAFVKKGSELAEQLDKDAGLGEDALAVMLTLDYEQFPHGEKHLVVRDYVSEGWFR